MVDASDIITYIGVPLAVLGVLPILYTFFYAYVTRNRIHKTLITHGHQPATRRVQRDGFKIRSSPMTSLIEVELPKYAIAPLDRTEPDYWSLNNTKAHNHEHINLLSKTDSSLSMIDQGRVSGYLQGGSWRLFNWKRLPVGYKLYRVQYVDELREPPAEIDFARLVDFLLDWGAELNYAGWEKLRTAGLWAPAGTVLLQLAGSAQSNRYNHDWILRTSTADESDGVLTLCVKWPIDAENGSSRGSSALPPGWMRLRLPKKDYPSTKSDEKRPASKTLVDLIHEQVHHDTSLSTGHFDSIRLRSIAKHVSEVTWEHNNLPSGPTTHLAHLTSRPHGLDWLTAAMSGLASCVPKSEANSVYMNSPVQSISSFLSSPLLPCGMLVLLDIVPSSAAPDWESAPIDTARESMRRGQAMMAKHHAKTAALSVENAMPEPQRSAARAAREKLELNRHMQESINESRERQERAEQQERDAVGSSSLDIKFTAGHALSCLKKQGEISEHFELHDIVNALVFLFIVDSSGDGKASRILEVLEKWRAWSELGGMKVDQLRWLRGFRKELCLAICIAAVALDGMEGHTSSGIECMLECLGHWKTVRLG